MKNKLTITIEGPAGSGKTQVSSIIAKALRKLSIEVILLDIEATEIDPEYAAYCLEFAEHSMEVTIVNKQTSARRLGA